MAAVALTLFVFIAGRTYLRGWIQQRSVPIWRACSFFLGLLAVWVAMVSPVGSLNGHTLTAHMIQHLLLMTIAPPLIWLGEPVVTAWPLMRWALPSGLSKPLGNPVLCWLASAAALIVWHVPAMLQMSMESSTWHVIQHVSFLVTGLLFWWPVIQPWPSVPRWPRWSMLLYLFLATVPCDVLSGLLVFSDRVVYPMYLSMPGMAPRVAGLSPLVDQQCAAALMWTCVTVVFLVAGTILSMQILSPKFRLQEGTTL